MEIIHLILGKANPERMNGVNKVVYQLAVQQTHFEKKIIVWGITKDKENNYGERNFETRLFLKKVNPFSISSELKTAIKEKKGKAIFHIHGGWIPIFYSIAKLLCQHKISFVFTPHGAYNTIAMDKSYWLKKIYFNLFEKTMLEKATKIHCIGKSEILGLANIYRNNKMILIPYGYQNKEKTVLADTINVDIVFGFVGRLDIYTKGLDILIEAFEAFVKKQPKAKLWIIGDSIEKEKLKKLISEKNLKTNAFLFGSKFGKDKETLLKNIDVFVHPSRNEGLPTSVIEAASYGKPCIVSNETNIGDLVSEYSAGETIEHLDPNELNIAMQNLLLSWQKPDEFIKIRQNAIRMVQENYNWENIIKEYNKKLYQV